MVDRVGVGLDLGLLLIKTGTRGHCDATNSATGQVLTVAGWGLQLLAWAFATLFIAGFTGAVRKPDRPPARPASIRSIRSTDRNLSRATVTNLSRHRQPHAEPRPADRGGRHRRRRRHRRDDPQAGRRVAFVFTEIFIFTGDRISRLETFHINLGGPADTLFTAPAADEAG
jgi:hypothetical protein